MEFKLHAFEIYEKEGFMWVKYKIVVDGEFKEFDEMLRWERFDHNQLMLGIQDFINGTADKL